MSKTVIIGGVAGGATAAARLRRRDEAMEIVLFERGEYISYANCGLPYYVGGVIQNRDALLLQKPETMRERFRVDVRTSQEVTAIDPQRQVVSVKNGRTGVCYEESYDHLVIATGSSPVVPPIPGIGGAGIYTLWTVPDTDRIRKYIEEKRPKTAAVIGGGFIGLEMAENLNQLGIRTTVIEMQDQVMAPLDFEMAQLLHENMEMNGVRLLLGDGVESFSSGRQEAVTIALKSGKRITADLVLLSIGVRPNSELAKEAGLALNAKGGIAVDRRLKTSDEHIYAVGDVIEVEHFISGARTMIPLAGPANKQARICADNIAGDEKEYVGTMGTSVAKVFDYTAAVVGLNEKTLKTMGKEKGKDYDSILINQKSHAGYYPGAAPLTLKLLFEAEGRILGAQIVGQEGADKRIDTIASVMRGRGTVYDLEDLELAYAPPFSSAKDPVNMLGFTAENVLRGFVEFISCRELDAMAASGEQSGKLTVLDVTEEVERMVYHIPGSVNIPLGQLRERMSELNPERFIVVYCAVGVRAYNAARILMQNGFGQVKVLEGGLSFYKSMHYRDFMRREPEIGKKESEEEMNGSAGNSGNTGGSGTAGSGGKAMGCGETEKAEMERAETEMAGTERAEAGKKEMRIIDCCGLQCPGPIMKVYETIREMEAGEVLEVSATDMGFARDIDSWCRQTGNTLLGTERRGTLNVVQIQKGSGNGSAAVSCPSCGPLESREQMQNQNQVRNQGRMQNQAQMQVQAQDQNGKTIVVFSGDMDKVLASFIIANGAAAMGRPVTMFFTFWGLNALRKTEKQPVKKSPVERMFGAMMPRGSGKLKLSKMNMGGLGTKMMKAVMREKHVDTLENLMQQAMKNGVKLVACTMSMDVMGIRKEELIDGVELAGVASYLADAEHSNVNLFV